MDETSVLAIILGNALVFVPLLLWSRSESREDNRQIDTKLRAIHEDMRDFHKRLVTIERERGELWRK